MKVCCSACNKLIYIRPSPTYKYRFKFLQLYTNSSANSNQLHVQKNLTGFHYNSANALSWNRMIGDHVRNECHQEALRLFSKMQSRGVNPHDFIFPLVLKACARLSTLQKGKEIHSHMVREGIELDVFVGSALIDMYAKCGLVEDARQVFDKIPQRDVALWNAMISGYAQDGCSLESWSLFMGMQMTEFRPNSSTLVSMLAVFACLGELHRGQQIHGYVVKSGCEGNVFVGTSLVELYANSGDIKDAAMVFDRMSEKNVVSWNAMISGHSNNGHATEALRLFRQMQLGLVKADSLTIISVLPGFAQLRALQEGKWVHGCAIKSGFESDVVVGTALIDMYAKCGMIDTARKLFDKMPERNVVSWSAMIGGYAYNGCTNGALRLFNKMQLENVQPNSVTLVSMLKVCTLLGAMEQGKAIHSYIARRGLDLDLSVQNTLVDMYAKCGSIEHASQMFNKMTERNLTSWNAMIAGYRIHGLAKEALDLFVQMQAVDMRPDHITFVCVLSACSHGGLVDEGWQYFYSMNKDHGVMPEVKHYACMVDLLGRSGRLDEALYFIEKMPLEPDASVWGALLGACRIHNNTKLGEHVADCLIDLEPHDAGYYVLLSNIYAAAGRWDDVVKLRTMMKDRRVKKTPGCSLVEVNNRVHAFLVGDRSHPQSKKIYDFLESLAVQMKEAGYIPDTNFVLHDIEKEGKENMLCSHSEKLAIAFSLLNTSPGTPIRITKNLRVCGDCHNVTKIISKIVNRKIIVRDANRFHHFNNGLCSCGDYW